MHDQNGLVSSLKMEVRLKKREERNILLAWNQQKLHSWLELDFFLKKNTDIFLEYLFRSKFVGCSFVLQFFKGPYLLIIGSANLIFHDLDIVKNDQHFFL